MDEMDVDYVIKVTLTNEILKRISEIDEKRFFLSTIEMPPVTKNRLRKNSKKKSSYASNKIEGNPLTAFCALRRSQMRFRTAALQSITAARFLVN